MKRGLYKVSITRDDETGYFVAEVPTLNPCITYGQTMEEALLMVQEAIEAVIESRVANGYPVPDDTDELEHQLTTVQAVIPVNQLPFQVAAA